MLRCFLFVAGLWYKCTDQWSSPAALCCWLWTVRDHWTPAGQGGQYQCMVILLVIDIIMLYSKTMIETTEILLCLLIELNWNSAFVHKLCVTDTFERAQFCFSVIIFCICNTYKLYSYEKCVDPCNQTCPSGQQFLLLNKHHACTVVCNIGLCLFIYSGLEFDWGSQDQRKVKHVGFIFSRFSADHDEIRYSIRPLQVEDPDIYLEWDVNVQGNQLLFNRLHQKLKHWHAFRGQ